MSTKHLILALLLLSLASCSSDGGSVAKRHQGPWIGAKESEHIKDLGSSSRAQEACESLKNDKGEFNLNTLRIHKSGDIIPIYANLEEIKEVSKEFALGKLDRDGLFTFSTLAVKELNIDVRSKTYISFSNQDTSFEMVTRIGSTGGVVDRLVYLKTSTKSIESFVNLIAEICL